MTDSSHSSGTAHRTFPPGRGKGRGAGTPKGRQIEIFHGPQSRIPRQHRQAGLDWREREGSEAMNSATCAPGVPLHHPERPKRGVGQIRPVDGPPITATFEIAGGMVIDGEWAALALVRDGEARA